MKNNHGSVSFFRKTGGVILLLLVVGNPILARAQAGLGRATKASSKADGLTGAVTAQHQGLEVTSPLVNHEEPSAKLGGGEPKPQVPCITINTTTTPLTNPAYFDCGVITQNCRAFPTDPPDPAGCTTCKFIQITNNLGPTCCVDALTLSTNKQQCFSPCGILYHPTGNLWNATGICDHFDKVIQDAVAHPPMKFCGGQTLEVKICGQFPMTLNVSFTDCNGNPCSQSIYIP